MVSSRTHHRKCVVQTNRVSPMYSIGICSLTRTLGLPHGGKGAERMERSESKTDAPQEFRGHSELPLAASLLGPLWENESWLLSLLCRTPLFFLLFTLIFPLLRLANPFPFSHELFLCCLFSSHWYVFLRRSYLGCSFVTCPQSDLMVFLFHCGQKTSAIRLQPFETHWVIYSNQHMVYLDDHSMCLENKCVFRSCWV